MQKKEEDAFMVFTKCSCGLFLLDLLLGNQEQYVVAYHLLDLLLFFGFVFFQFNFFFKFVKKFLSFFGFGFLFRD